MVAGRADTPCPGAARLARLEAATLPVVAPSLLSCDFARVAEQLQSLKAAGVVAVHLDVMDGHFVPNLSYGLPLVESCRRLTQLPLDVHLMVGNVLEHDYLRRYREAGADVMTVHIEALRCRPLGVFGDRVVACHLLGDAALGLALGQ